MDERIEPMSNVVCIWRDGYGGYPEGVRIAFRDGKIVRFWREIEQPAPNVIPDYKPKHLKKTGAAATTPGQREWTQVHYSTEMERKQ